MPAPLQPELLREDYAELNVLFVHSRIDDSGLSVFAFRVYAHLARRASASGCAWPSIATIARVCGIGETRVREALRELVDRRLIDRQPRENQSYVVRLTPPSLWLAAPVAPAAPAAPPTPLATGPVVRETREAPGFAPRTPSPREPVRLANHPGSPGEPEGYPLKEIATPARPEPDRPDSDSDRTAAAPSAMAAGMSLPAPSSPSGIRASTSSTRIQFLNTGSAGAAPTMASSPPPAASGSRRIPTPSSSSPTRSCTGRTSPRPPSPTASSSSTAATPRPARRLSPMGRSPASSTAPPSPATARATSAAATR